MTLHIELESAHPVTGRAAWRLAQAWRALDGRGVRIGRGRGALSGHPRVRIGLGSLVRPSALVRFDLPFADPEAADQLALTIAAWDALGERESWRALSAPLPRVHRGTPQKDRGWALSLAGPSPSGPSLAGSSLAGPNLAGSSLAGPSPSGSSPSAPSPSAPSLAGPNLARPSPSGPNLARPSPSALSLAGQRSAGPEQLHVIGGLPRVTGDDVWWPRWPSVVAALLGRADYVLGPAGPLVYDAVRAGVDVRTEIAPGTLAGLVPPSLERASELWLHVAETARAVHVRGDAPAPLTTPAWIARGRERIRAHLDSPPSAWERLRRRHDKLRRDPRRFFADSKHPSVRKLGQMLREHEG